MPINMNYISKRFDFGVPLEDIFPPNDIHPRLKYLFEEAYKFYINSELNLEQITRQLQGSLETRLKLKQKIINDIHYDINTEELKRAPGAYFWLIRHFLGLLPIPLLPTYSQEIYYDWINLSEKCKNFLQHYESEKDKKYKLDYELAENFNLLPFEHFLLLTVLIHFIRKLSKKIKRGRNISRRSLIFLCKYYCASICMRPYIPGQGDHKLFPLIFYVVLRWREIEKNCRLIGHPTYFLEDGYSNYKSYTGSSVRDNCVQTTHFNPKVIPVYKIVPYFCDNNNYLKDNSCQTEKTDSIDKGIQSLEIISEDRQSVEPKIEKLSDQESSCLYPSLTNAVSPTIEEDRYFIQGEKVCNDVEQGCFSNEGTSSNIQWTDVVKETAGTVKKVEEYIYDDYDTFTKEEYNQISDSNKSRTSFMRKVSKIGWTYTPENSAREENKEIDSGRNEVDSYVRFEDVFDENGKYKVNDVCDDSNETKNNGLDITFKKYNNSRTPLFKNQASNGIDVAEDKRKKNFNLKRFKLKLDFLRVLTPKRGTYSTPSYDSIDSKVKYKKIKSIKSKTL